MSMKEKFLFQNLQDTVCPLLIFLMSNSAWTSARSKLLGQEESWLERSSAV